MVNNSLVLSKAHYNKEITTEQRTTLTQLFEKEGIDLNSGGGISDGVRKLVLHLFLNGFLPTDSGDGSHYEEGMECAVPYAMIGMSVSYEYGRDEAKRLLDLIHSWGICTDPMVEGSASVQVMYNPEDDHTVLALFNAVSADMKNV